ncbi:thiamine pyrophosphate-dependent enzyme [bacterium]|nr:thiamine pyrophosphate-dependent enzyme [bacterium]
MIDNLILKSITKKGKKENTLRSEALEDFWTCLVSREASLMARKEVLTGKAKFGITGDGKEVPQVALARAFKKGDWRSGYYRDQTFMFAMGLSSVEAFFAQLYADPDNDPFSGGRQMNSHYSTNLFDEKGDWLDHKDLYNVSSDISSTAGQMARALGLALASKKYRESKVLKNTQFSNKGNEISWVTIGDASTSEGVFWETINAAGVQKLPMAVCVWDDGYGISVPKKYQTTKGDISTLLEGFRINEEGVGYNMYNVKGWDYKGLRDMFNKGAEAMRENHNPALFHVDELTQPQGHSTSGSHERYKSKERLNWEQENDCLKRMEEWMIDQKYISQEDVEILRENAKQYVKEAKNNAWKMFIDPIKIEIQTLSEMYTQLQNEVQNPEEVHSIHKSMNNLFSPMISEILANARKMLFATIGADSNARENIVLWIERVEQLGDERYHTHLYSNSPKSALRVPVIPPVYTEKSPKLNGFEVLNKCFDKALKRLPEMFAFGEDVGHIGDVNQGFAGLQEKHGVERIFDTGIREWSIMGQAIGMSMRGMRPIAEIQYLDYLIYGLEPLTDDLATMRWRSNNLQQAPAIIRTRGHRLEGVWHAGSPIGMIINSLRGMYVLTPRNMTQAAGFYNTLLQSDDPAIVIECLNGYRLKESLPDNIDKFTVPLGVPEIMQKGSDVTLVTYGSCVRIAQAGIAQLEKQNISVELIDVQTLLPFDLEHQIVESIKKTNRVVFLDEDFPGGASAYMMQEVLEKQEGYAYLDAQPLTITAHPNRSPYGSDGDYFSKPNAEDVFEVIYNMMRDGEPDRFLEIR